MLDCDILIVGGGIVGLTLANALADKDWRIVIVDHQPRPVLKPNISYDLRVSAINHASQAIFQSFNLWEQMQQHGLSCFQRMQVWDENSAAAIQFDCAEVKQAYLGHILEHSVMKHALAQRLQAYNNVRVLYSTSALSLQEGQGEIKLQLNNACLVSRLLVGADGANSWVAKKAGLLSKSRSYQQSAIVATIRSQHPHQQTAWQRFLSTGPVALLPLSDAHCSSLVWSTSPTQAKFLQQTEEGEFNRHLTSALEHRLGNLEVMSERRIFPLQESHAPHYVKSGIALIGDAAHTLHPLAGQGVNLGLLDAVCLAEVLQQAQQTHRDFAHILTLRRYERWRRGENMLMIKAMAGFRSCFASSSWIAKNTRHWGFSITEKIPPLKSFFIRRAMGLQGDLPKRAVFYEEI